MLTRLCKQFEQAILHDPGQRGIQNLFITGELYRSLYLLNYASQHVVIGTGFPCTDFNPPTESDGPPGCMILAYSLLKQYPDRKVTVIYDPIHDSVMQPLTDAFNEEFHAVSDNANIDQKLNAFNTEDIQTSEQFFALSQFQDIDHMIAIELSGPNKDGQHKTMKNVDISDRCHITSNLFDYAFKNKVCMTTGIGDGGNETGMHKVREKVEKHIEFGSEIGCSVETQFLITAGVSNWGAEALAFGLHMNDIMNTLNTDSQIYCSSEFHEKMYRLCGEYGAADAMRRAFDGGVDGMEYSVHKQMFEKLRDITQTQQDVMFPKLV